MAEKRFLKGLFKDTSHIDQPVGSWRYAKNIIIADKKGSLSNEGGTSLNTFLIEDGNLHHFDKVVGAIEVSDDKVVLFMVDINPNPPTGIKHLLGLPIHSSMIGIWENGHGFTRLYDPDIDITGHDLNFSIEHPIEGTYKIDAKGNLVVYWTDDYNPPRVFNVTRQQEAIATSGVNTAWLYGIDPWKAGKDHINFLNLFPHSGPVPHIDLEYIYTTNDTDYQSSVIEGGGLRTGVYYLALAYVDDDFVATNFLTVSNPVSIVDEYDHTRPTSKKDGMKAGSQTSKAIKWKVSNLKISNPVSGQLDEVVDYKYLRPVVIRKMGDATEAFRLNDIDLPVASDTGIVFSGIEGFTPGSVEDIIIDTISYETAKTINQLDGVLYLGNLTSSIDLGYQKYANNIKLRSVTKSIPKFDEYWATLGALDTGYGGDPDTNFFPTVDNGNYVDDSKSYRYIPNSTKFRGYQRDEVYAFYIAFILRDGSMSYAYHIPGRNDLTTLQPAPTSAGGGDPDEITLHSCLTPVREKGNIPSQGLYNDLKELNEGYSRNFHFFDYSDVDSAITNHMNYWENATEFYPNTDDFEIWDLSGQIGSLRNDGVYNTTDVNVRHHHFPSNENDQRKSIKTFHTGEVQGATSDPTAFEHVIEAKLCAGGNLNMGIAMSSFGNWAHDQSCGTTNPFDQLNNPGRAGHFSNSNMGTYRPKFEELGGPLNGVNIGGLPYNDAMTTGAYQNGVYTASFPCQVIVEYCLWTESTQNSFFSYAGRNCSVGARVASDSIINTNNPPAGFTPSSPNPLGHRHSLTSWVGSIDTLQNYVAKYTETFGSTLDHWYINCLTSTCSEGALGVGSLLPGSQGGQSTAWPSQGLREKFTLDVGEKLWMEAISTSVSFDFATDNNMITNLRWQWLNSGPYSKNPDLGPMGCQYDDPSVDHTRTSIGHVGTSATTITNTNSTKYSWIRFHVIPDATLAGTNYYDAKISQKVYRLGFQLSDIQIPSSIAEQVQGFRIYYAKRGHSNKRILGQSVVIPMLQKTAKLGACSNSLSQPDSTEVLQTEREDPITFWSKYPFASSEWNYRAYNLEYGSNIPSCVGTDWDSWSYKAFSFHDFNLLRTKNSLAGATHIKPEYKCVNAVWNAPSLEQDRKMISKMVDDTSTSPPVKVIKQNWGWSANWECYTQNKRGSIHMGLNYYQMLTTTAVEPDAAGVLWSSPKVLGQKAKTYLRGDSIFKGGSLGFGNKVFNEFGESCAIFGLKDGHELKAFECRPWDDVNSPLGDDSHNYNHAQTYGYSLLVNPYIFDNTTGPTPGHPTYWEFIRSQYYMINLHSFKTDMYKSIDSQQLVWTGFEVLGEDINNFVFEEDTGDPRVYEYLQYTDSNDDRITHAADFSTAGLQYTLKVVGGNNIMPDDDQGIFGGDTFLARYGFAAGLRPNNTEEDATPFAAMHYHIVESPDNINFRHTEDDKSLYFPQSICKEMLEGVGNQDYTAIDNMKYNDNYSVLNDVRPVFPLPLRDPNQNDFPTRTHRSAKSDATSLTDNFRIFLANQFKDLPKNRGELWKLSTFNNLLYFHMEESLFAAKGKQSMQMKDGSEAFVGSGDIFKQDPDELVQTKDGFGGTQSQWAALTTRHGYFFVDSITRKVFLMKDKLNEISSLGMESWFRDNLKFEVENYGYTGCDIDNPIKGFGFHSVWDPKYKRFILTKREFIPTDEFKYGYRKSVTTADPEVCGSGRPNGYIDFFTSSCVYKIWEEEDCTPSPCPCSWTTIDYTDTQYFTKGGWTISFYPELSIWVGFHDYIPYLYFNDSKSFFSFTDMHPHPSDVWSNLTTGQRQVYAQTNGTVYGNSGLWEHNADRKGILYQENESSSISAMSMTDWEEMATYYSFEIEFIHNELKDADNLYSNFSYTLDTFNQENINILNHGFTHFFIYDTHQLSGLGSHWQDRFGIAQEDSTGQILTAANVDSLEYLVNIRRVGNNWKVNSFRDMATLAVNTGNYYMSTNTNIIGGINTGTTTTSDTASMFLVAGMHEIPNAVYLNLLPITNPNHKTWDQRRKFIDKWVGIRLIYDNITNNLLNLYSTNVGTRKLYR